MKMSDTEPYDLDSRLTEIEQWLVERSKSIQGTPLTNISLDFDLVDNGLIDSLRLVEFAFILGKATGRHPNLREIRLSQFRTMRLIGEYFASETK